jgi:hypothetical protein
VYGYFCIGNISFRHEKKRCVVVINKKNYLYKLGSSFIKDEFR